MRSEIKIRNRTLGFANPLFIMAEVGVTSNYDMRMAKELIDIVSASGADAVKFILWFPEEIMSDKTVLYEYQTVNGPKSENMFEMLSRLRFKIEEWRELKKYADAKDVILFATVNSPSGIEWAEALGLEAYKLSSWDYNYTSLWKRIAALGKPMLIDTGPVNTFEVAKALRIMLDAGNDQCVLVHTVHTDDYAQINMNSIPYMRHAFNTLVGYSARDRSTETDIMAVTLGAVLLEKRLTLNRSLPGHHHILSMEPKEFDAYVKMMRDVRSALGVNDLVPSPRDLAERKRWFRHLVAKRDLPKGIVLTADMLEAKRPETDVSPEALDYFVGRVTKRDLKYNEAISWGDV
jgi:N,N'-diacetyllegionaminate synthase